MINRIKTFFKRRRIIEINGRFIPQVRVNQNWIFEWEWQGVSATEYSTYTEYRTYDKWYDQRDKCSVPTKDQAALNLYGWLESQRLKKLADKQIIHEVEPEAWVKLKEKK